MILGVKIRKVLTSALYDKVAKLSTKGLAQTNSGKLITLVSADIFAAERFMTLVPFCISKPIINLVVIVFYSVTEHWSYGATILFWYLFMNLMQIASGAKAKELKIEEGQANDVRVKLISDMITGIRTIKSYGWEKNYMEKINDARSKQHTLVWWTNFLGTLGMSFFNNFGFLAYLQILLINYWRGNTFVVSD